MWFATMLKTASKVTINTGNVLNLIDIKKKAGQNVTEEVSIICFLNFFFKVKWVSLTITKSR